MTVSDLLEQLVTGLIMPLSLLQVVNNLFQTCYSKSGTSSAKTTCYQLVNRLLTTCVFLCVYLSHARKTRNSQSCKSMQYVSLIQASAPIKIHAHITRYST